MLDLTLIFFIVVSLPAIGTSVETVPSRGRMRRR
jgi:hypothetical protein